MMELLDDRILLKRVMTGETRPGKIVIPDQAVELGDCAEIVAVGQGPVRRHGKRKHRVLGDDGNPIRDAPELAPGDTVVINKYSGTPIEVEGEDLLVLREVDVLAKVEYLENSELST